MIRQSLGTRTITGLNEWLYRTFVKGRSTYADLTDYRSGRLLRVYCSTPDIGIPRPILGTNNMHHSNKQGYLHLRLDRPVEWHAMGGGEIVRVTAIGPLTPAGDVYAKSATLSGLVKRIGAYQLETPDGTKRMNLPRIDATLVAEAFRAR
jgi:hypothetical protein